MADHRIVAVDGIRARLTGREEIERIFRYFLSEEVNIRSSFFALGDDGLTYFYSGEERKLYSMGSPRNPNLDFLAYLTEHYGLFGSERTTRQLLDKIDSYSRIHGKRPSVRRFAHFDKEADTLYLSRYDGTCYKLDGESVTVIPNGNEVLFVDDDEGKTCDADIGPHGILFPSVIGDVQYSDETLSKTSQETLLTIWMHLIAFGSLLPGPPILLLEGEKGSGKTTAIKRIQLMAQGTIQNQRLTNKREDFLLTITRMPIALLDNVDSYVGWLPDAIAAYCTGSGDMKRQLYTDTAQVKIHPTSFPAITSRNPKSFRRDDVADRCIVLRLERREGRGGYKPEREVVDFIINNRPKLYGEWLWNLNQIIRARKTAEYPESASQYRLTDFVHFGYNIGQVLGWDQERITETFEEFKKEQEALSMDGDDTLVVLLDKWLESPLHKDDGPVTAADLYIKLATQSGFTGIAMPVNSPRSLANRLRDSKGSLRRFFEVDIVGAAHNNRKLYHIRRKVG